MDEQAKKGIKAYKKRTHPMLSVVSKITEAKTLDELKEGVRAFKNFWDAHPRLKRQLCDLLLETVVDANRLYLQSLPSQDKNIVFIPPDVAPVAMIPTCVFNCRGRLCL